MGQGERLLRGLSLPDRVCDELRQDILSGRLAPGSRLPTVIELARHFGVSTHSVGNGLDRLEVDGLIVKRQGRGIHVAERPATLPIAIYSELDVLHPRTSYYYRQLPRQLGAFLEQRGFPTAFYMGRTQPGEHADGPTCPRFTRDVETGQLSGAVFTAVGNTDRWHHWARRFPLPAVGTGAVYESQINYPAMVEAGVAELARQGCRRPAMLAWAVSRLDEVFQATLEKYGMEWHPDRVRSDLHPQLSGAGWEEFRELWLARCGHPDGLLICDDVLFDEVRISILELGIAVPEQLKVVTYAHRGAEVCYPFPVTLLEMDLGDVTDALGSAMLRRVRNEPVTAPVFLTPTVRTVPVERPGIRKAQAGTQVAALG